MPLNRQHTIRQNSSVMLSPFSKHNCGIEHDVLIKPKRLDQRGIQQRRKHSLLGNNMNTNWFKSTDTDTSLQTDNGVTSSLDSMYDSPLILHSAKTQNSSENASVDPTQKRTHLNVRTKTTNISKSGDARFRKKGLLDDVDSNRPTTVGATRDSIKDIGGITDSGGGYRLQINSLTKGVHGETAGELNKKVKVEIKSVEPLPPIQHSINSEPDNTAVIHVKNDSYHMSEDGVNDNDRESPDPTATEAIGTDKESGSTAVIQKGEDADSHAIETVLHEENHPGYRSITPLSLCDVLSDIDTKTIYSGVFPGSVSISDSEEFDTDLETDGNSKKDNLPLEDTNICRWIYREQCKRLMTPPQKHILKGLAERSLSLRNRSLGPKAIQPLCNALKDNLRMERLNLDGTDITDDGIQHVAEMLLENITLSHINLANNTLGLRASQVLSHVMIVTENLTHLNLTGNRFDDHSAWYLSAGIGSNTSITHLDLSYNDFGEQGGVLLGTGLARNTKLLVLNLTWNKVCGKGSVAIFQALMVNHVLEILDISWNGLGYDGAVALSKCLKVNKSLVDIDVSNNRMDWRTGFLLAEGLTLNHTIQKLRLGYNPLTTTGCMDILEAIAAEKSTINLLDCSGITVVGEAELLSATISRRRKFQFLHGGIVTTHDKVGEKQDREVDPMLRIIEYLRLLGLRPLELMKSFDKSSSAFELPRKEFIEQIKKIGVKLQPFEIDALANSVSGKGYNKNVINYRKLSMAVREVVQAERERKMREREEYMQIKSYHETILRKGQLDYSRNSSKIADKDTLKAGGIQAGSSVFGASIESVSSMTRISPIRSKVQLSMCSPLESSRSTILSPKKRKKRVKKKKDSRA